MTEVASGYVSLTPQLSKDAGAKLSRDINGKLRTADGKFAGAGARSGKSFGVGFGKVLGGGGAALGLGALIKSSSVLEQRFSKTMALVAASTGAPQSEMKSLNALAMRLGAATNFSANEAADAMLELGKAGISTSDIMGGALKGTLLLATAGGLDLASSATIASNAMNTFGLRGKDMNKIAAALAGGANASSASVQSLGQALQQVGPGAKNAGLNLQQTVGVLSSFDAAGIKGSDAGTSLKTMLTRLVPQTDKARTAMSKLGLDFTKSNGSFVSITNVADQLRKKLGPLSEEQRTTALTTIFGSDATRAATVLMNQGAKGLGKYIKATQDQGAAQKMAKAAMSGTAGAMERLRGSVETAQLALGQALAPTITNVANWLSNRAVPAVTKFITQMRTGEGAGGQLADTIGNIVDTGKGLLSFFNSLPGPVKKFAGAFLVGSLAMRKLNTRVGPGITKMGNHVGSLRNVETRGATVATKLQKVGGALRGLAGAGGMALLVDSTTRSAGALSTLESAAGGALSGAALGAFAGPPGAAIGAAVGGIAGATLGLLRSTKGAGDAARSSLGSWKGYASTLDQATGAVTGLTRQQALQRLDASGLLSTTRKLGLSDREVVNAVVSQGAERTRLGAAIQGNIDKLNAEQAANTKNIVTVGRGGAQSAAMVAQKNREIQKRIDNYLAIQRELGAVDKAVNSKRREIAITRTFSGAIKSLPPAVQTELKTKGLEKSRAAVVDLTSRYNLARKDVRTLIKENGGRPTKAMIDSILASAKQLDKQKSKPSVKLQAAGVLSAIHAIGSALDSASRDRVARIRVQRYSDNSGIGGADGTRASGGPTRARRTYLVGENGPELFRERRAGEIVANDDLAGAGSMLGGGPTQLHVYDTDGALIGTMEAVADERIAASSELEG